MTGRWLYPVLICVAVVGAILLLIGGILVPVFSYKFYSSKQVGHTSFYFFNISNPDEIVQTGQNTTVNQVGPYVYRLTLEMRHISFSERRNHLSFELHRKYTFDESLSVGNETDEITTVNLPILNLATRLQSTNETIERTVSDIIGRVKEGLFGRIPVSDLLWGYENDNIGNLTDFLKHRFGINPIKDTTYGLLYQSGQRHRTTFEGTFEVSTGKDDAFNKWNIEKWNGMSSLNVWNSGRCNSINGTDGYAWPPSPPPPSGLNASVPVHIFESDWCRSIDLVVTRSEESIDEMNKTIEYRYNRDSFGYGGWRRGFCQPTPHAMNRSSCLRDGVLNVTKCKDNIPLLLSQPHFLDADESYIHAVRGLKPDPKYHATYFKVDQSSGEVVEGSRKLQLNAYVMNLTSFPDTKSFTDNITVIPIAWMEEVYSMTEKEKESILSQRKFYDDVMYSLIGIGVVMIAFALVALIVVTLANRGRPQGERQPLLGD